jgi:uncharacterized protein YqjF (DUF2071 family)
VGTSGSFLTAVWRDLVLLNYEVPPELLTPLVPAGTRLDQYRGRSMASMVGFRFLETRVLGVPIPFHRAFEEVNLRFYVVRESRGERRRGVVFVRVVVPKAAVAWLARVSYHEPYLRVPMSHEIVPAPGAAHPARVEYSWIFGGSAFRLGGALRAGPTPLVRPSEAEFITEHYWGYNRQPDGSTMEYQVLHPSWAVAELEEPFLIGNVAALYGEPWRKVLERRPVSAFYATGSPVSVHRGRRLAPDAASRRRAGASRR